MEEAPTPPSGGWTGRDIAIVVAILVVTNAVTGVVVFLAAPQDPAIRVLNVVAPWTEAELDRFQPVMDFWSAQEGVVINYLPFRQEVIVPVLPASFEAQKTPADLLIGIPAGVIKQFGTDGHLVDMTSVNTASDVSPDIFDLVEVSNVQWGGAYTGKAKLGFWYKASFFEGTGLDPAAITTYNEFSTLLASVQAMPGITNPIVSGDGVGWPLSDITEHFIASFGGAQMHRNLVAGALSWEDATVKDIFNTKLNPWITAGYFSAPVDFPEPSYTNWWNEEYAFYFMGSWITADIPALIPGADQSDMRVVSLPSTIGGTVFPADYFMIPRYTANLDLATSFAQFLMSDQGQELQIRQGGHIATATGVPLLAYPEGLDRSIGASMAGRVLLNDMDDAIGQPWQGVFWTQLQALWIGSSTVDAVLAAIQAAR